MATLLHRIDPERNEARFYFVQAGSSVIDAHAVLRLWGRIGGHQCALATPCASAEEANQLVDRLIRLRLRHGYHIVQIPERSRSVYTDP